MTDCFALLGLPCRPGLDEAVLQKNYLSLAARWHPDAPEGDVAKFRDLQEARKTLADPAARLRHLLALEGGEGAASGGVQPPGDLFLEIAGALDAGKKTTASLQAARSAIARAALAGERIRAERRIEAASARVEERRGRLHERIVQSDVRWPEKNLPDLDAIGRELAFLSRWEGELRERLFLLRNPPES